MILVRFTQYSTHPIKNIVEYEVGTILEGSMGDSVVYVKYSELCSHIPTKDLEIYTHGTL